MFVFCRRCKLIQQHILFRDVTVSRELYIIFGRFLLQISMSESYLASHLSSTCESRYQTHLCKVINTEMFFRCFCTLK